MSRLCVFAMLAVWFFAGCTTRETGHTWDYKALSTRPTPRDWKPGAVWTFASTKKTGEIESFTFRVTDEVAQTCTSGTWRKLEVIRGHIPQVERGRAQPAFCVEGSFLSISLLAPWCDIDDDIQGGLDGKTFTGDRSKGGMMGSDIVGTVRGWRVK